MQFSEDKSLGIEPDLPEMPCFSEMTRVVIEGPSSVNKWTFPKYKYASFTKKRKSPIG